MTIMKLLRFLPVILSTALFAQNTVDVLREKAEAGDVEALRNLGTLYYEGIETPQNYGRAREWYSKAASLGDAFSQFRMADMFVRAEGVEKDLLQAYVWYSMAAVQDFKPNWMEFIDAKMMREITGNELKLVSISALNAAQEAATKCFESRYRECETSAIKGQL